MQASARISYLLNFIQITVNVVSRSRWVSVLFVLSDFLLKKELKLGKIGKCSPVLSWQQGHQSGKRVIQLLRDKHIWSLGCKSPSIVNIKSKLIITFLNGCS